MRDNQRQRNPRRSVISFLIVLTCCGFFFGCSAGESERAVGDVSITLTNGGQPVTVGHVELETDRPGEGSGGDLDASGVAKLTGVTVGDYTVTVRPAIIVQVPGEPVPKKPDESAFPEKFRNLKSSPLKIHVDEGENEATFDLKEVK